MVILSISTGKTLMPLFFKSSDKVLIFVIRKISAPFSSHPKQDLIYEI